MKYKRLIPIILIKEGLLVRSQLFKYHQAIGDPIPTIKRLSDWSVDEIILLNIGKSNQLDSRRDDKWHNIGTSSHNKLVEKVSKFCFAPLSVGGGIRSKRQISELFNYGADKCILNTLIFHDTEKVKWDACRPCPPRARTPAAASSARAPRSRPCTCPRSSRSSRT